MKDNQNDGQMIGFPGLVRPAFFASYFRNLRRCMDTELGSTVGYSANCGKVLDHRPHHRVVKRSIPDGPLLEPKFPSAEDRVRSLEALPTNGTAH